MTNGFTGQEILTQSDAWLAGIDVLQTRQDAIHQFWQDGQYEQVIFTGCGSTHYLARTAAHIFQAKTGVPSWAGPASELLFYPDSLYLRNKSTLLVTISRSATTTETVQVAQTFRERYGNHVLTISCYDDKALNDESALTLATFEGQEKSVAQTRSFSSMLVLAEGLALIAGGQQDIDWQGAKSHINSDIMLQAQELAQSYVAPEQFERYFYLGSGELYGLASEAMLKMKEMSLTQAEAYHPLEFRHGPMSMVDDETVIVGLLDTHTYAPEKAVLDEMRGFGATIVEISPETSATFTIPASTAINLVHYMPLLQLMAYERALSRSLNPDQPRHLNQVVELNDGLSGMT